MIDPETVVRLMRAEGSTVTFTANAEIVCDEDGNPTGVSPGTETEAELMPVMLTGEEWEQTARYLLTMLDTQTEYANGLQRLLDKQIDHMKSTIERKKK